METKVETRTAPCPLAQTPRSPEVSRPFNAANGYSIEIVILTRDRANARANPRMRIIIVSPSHLPYSILDLPLRTGSRRDRPRVGRAHRPAPRARRPRGARTTIHQPHAAHAACPGARARGVARSPSRAAPPLAPAPARGGAGRFRRSFGGCHCHIVCAVCVQRGRQTSEPV